ncbi:MAG: hypothetical protein ACF788_01545 [Novipirellula sp. JB048]
MANASRGNPDSKTTRAARRHDFFYLLVGFTLICLGLVLGWFSGLPQCHRGFAMKSYPREISLAELHTTGLRENAFVQLADVDFSRPEVPHWLEPLTSTLTQLAHPAELAHDPNRVHRELDSLRQAFFAPLAPASAEPRFVESARGVGLFPKGDRAQHREPIVTLSRHRNTLDLARKQIEDHDRVRGFLSIDHTASTIRALKRLHQSGLRERDASEWLTTLQQIGQSKPGPAATYRLEPMEAAPAKSTAASLLAISTLSLALGLIVCGSSSLSLWAWLLLPIPSLLSLFGVALRRGRGGQITRFAYHVVGLGLLGIGLFHTIALAGFGQPGGDSLHSFVGWLMSAAGIAAVGGALIHAHTSRPAPIPNVATPPAPQARTTKLLRYNATPGESETAHASLESPQSTRTSPTEEAPLLLECEDDSGHRSMRDSIERFSEFGFSTPTFVGVQDSKRGAMLGLLLGCNHTVLAEIGDEPTDPSIRLTSVLQDGFTVLSVSERMAQRDATKPAKPGFSQPGFSQQGFCQTAPHEPLSTMLAQHLQRTIELSEQRGCSILTLEDDDKSQVCALSFRVFADWQSRAEASSLAATLANEAPIQSPVPRSAAQRDAAQRDAGQRDAGQPIAAPLAASSLSRLSNA